MDVFFLFFMSPWFPGVDFDYFENPSGILMGMFWTKQGLKTIKAGMSWNKRSLRFCLFLMLNNSLTVCALRKLMSVILVYAVIITTR